VNTCLESLARVPARRIYLCPSREYPSLNSRKLAVFGSQTDGPAWSSAGGPALQRVLQQRPVAAVPLRAAEHGHEAQRDADPAVPVERLPGRQQVPPVGPASVSLIHRIRKLSCLG